LLVVYSAVIFQEGVVEGLHLLSHATEIFSNNFAFHHHGNGKIHFHHHGFMDTVNALLHHDDQQERPSTELPISQQEVKLHLLVSASFDLHPIYGLGFHYFHHNENVRGRIPEVLTPPPRS
jgi:hypothetical protein